MANNILKYLIIDMEKTAGKRFLLLDVRTYYGYKEGVKGNPEGLTFNCLSETMGYEKIDIKVEGLMQLPFKFDGTPIPVEFDSLEGKVWQDWSSKGEVKLSVAAKGIRLLTGKCVKIGEDKA